MHKGKKMMKKVGKIIGMALLVVVLTFFIGRYSWRLFGYQFCRAGESLGITEVTVDEAQVYVHVFEPGSFPNYCIGYRYHFKDGNLYIGVKYSHLIGVWLDDTGERSIQIPLKGQQVDQIFIKSSKSERLIWSREE